MLAINQEDTGLEEIRKQIIKKWESKEVFDNLQRVYLWGAHEKREHQLYLASTIPSVKMIKKFLISKGLTVAYSNISTDRVGIGIHQSLRTPNPSPLAIKAINFIICAISDKVLWSRSDSTSEVIVPYEDTIEYKKIFERNDKVRSETLTRLSLSGLLEFSLSYREAEGDADEHTYTTEISARVKSINSENIYDTHLSLTTIPNIGIQAVNGQGCSCIGFRTHGGNSCKHISLLKMLVQIPGIKRTIMAGIIATFKWDTMNLEYRANNTPNISPIVHDRHVDSITAGLVTIERVTASPIPTNNGRRLDFEVSYRHRHFTVSILTRVSSGQEIYGGMIIIPVRSANQGVVPFPYRDAIGEHIVRELQSGMFIANPYASGESMMYRAINTHSSFDTQYSGDSIDAPEDDINEDSDEDR